MSISQELGLVQRAGNLHDILEGIKPECHVDIVYKGEDGQRRMIFYGNIMDFLHSEGYQKYQYKEVYYTAIGFDYLALIPHTTWGISIRERQN